MKISGVITALNEADKLAECLESIQNFVDEIVIIDLDSTDDLAEVAKKFGAKVYTHKRVKFVELVRNFSISKANGEWILLLDPDERIPKFLFKKLKEVVSEKKYQAVNIPRKNIFFGSWISHTNFWPDRHIRFFKKNAVNWPEIIHTYPKVSGEILTLPVDPDLAIIHYGYNSYSDFYKRQQRYAAVDAKNRLDQGKKFSVTQLFWKPTREFLVRFIKHQAFLDGFNGIVLVLGLMYYQILVEIKMLKR